MGESLCFRGDFATIASWLVCRAEEFHYGPIRETEQHQLVIFTQLRPIFSNGAAFAAAA
ncbi:hypothetical protein THI_0116 [Thiomonas arsenitoxydans]|uniref:Uncharacterized protein n=1 Tax=Thiomonas arsenitoxydans (strain DSM 22701 / CIP 110005 / 3As) TaxID=426114 RepID=D6CQI3_THIA3|nr:hypothetical protein THI_0116 [Thiomonas arsenitoxydans]